jgi:hypothetical protein
MIKQVHSLVSDTGVSNVISEDRIFARFLGFEPEPLDAPPHTPFMMWEILDISQEDPFGWTETWIENENGELLHMSRRSWWSQHLKERGIVLINGQMGRPHKPQPNQWQ